MKKLLLILLLTSSVYGQLSSIDANQPSWYSSQMPRLYNNWEYLLSAFEENVLDFNDVRIAVGSVINVKHSDYGATGDGSTDDLTALQTAEALADDDGGTLLFPPGDYEISDDWTVSSNVSLWFPPGAKISVASGKTITVDSPDNIIATDTQQIIVPADVNSLIFNSGGTVSPCWWGANRGGASATTTTKAIQYAIDSLCNYANPANPAAGGSNTGIGGTVLCPCGLYAINDTIYLKNCVSLKSPASGKLGTGENLLYGAIFDNGLASDSEPMLEVRSHCTVEGMVFIDIDNAEQGYHLRLSHENATIRNCRISGGVHPIYLIDTYADIVPTYCLIEHCYIDQWAEDGNAVAIEYAGVESGTGSGLIFRHNNVNAAANGGYGGQYGIITVSTTQIGNATIEDNNFQGFANLIGNSRNYINCVNSVIRDNSGSEYQGTSNNFLEIVGSDNLVTGNNTSISVCINLDNCDYSSFVNNDSSADYGVYCESDSTGNTFEFNWGCSNYIGSALNTVIQNRYINVADAGPTDNLNVTACSHVILATASNNVTIGGLVGGFSGQTIVLIKNNAANDAVIENEEGGGNQDIITSSGGDETISAVKGVWVLTFDGTNWYEY
jgi:hypothetical protein